uniref:protein-glutamine gamma-glutamyltransferase n=1 Tax=Oncorhynchus kisutch TaxID=8019 RepID=A0A8C7GHB8_ONCKI
RPPWHPTMILPARDGISVSLRLMDGTSKLIKGDHEKSVSKPHAKPLVKPVGWVSPNTWDTSWNYCEIEGDYVDLVEFSKEKESPAGCSRTPKPSNSPPLFKPVRPPPPIPLGSSTPCGCTLRFSEEPCTPCSQRRLGQEPSGHELKCRYRDSYLAALRNPVPFEMGSVGLLAIPIREDAINDVNTFTFWLDKCICRFFLVQDPSPGKVETQATAPSIGPDTKLQSPKTKPSAPPILPPSPIHRAPPYPPSQDSIFRSISGLLHLGFVSLPGIVFVLHDIQCYPVLSNKKHKCSSRDRVGRAVLEVHGNRQAWMSPLLSAQEVCKVLLYLHSIPRKEVRDLGMTVVINARKMHPPSLFYKALMMVQMEVVTSLKALHKMVEGQQLTSDLGGNFPYSHTDWLQFHQKLVSFVSDLQGAAHLLHRDVQLSIQDQKTSMKEVLQDARLVPLQREGGAILTRMRREEFRFTKSDDYRDALDSVTVLYNQVEENVHTLVMKSNESLQYLDFLLKLREAESNLNTVGQEVLNLQNIQLEVLYIEKKQETLTLVMEVEKILGSTNSNPETEVFRTVMNTFKSNMADFMLRAEQRRTELDNTVHVYRFCEEAAALAKECKQYLEQLEKGCYPAKACLSMLKSYEERLGNCFSSRHFQKIKACSVKSSRGMNLWNATWVQCQEVSQWLGERLETDLKTGDLVAGCEAFPWKHGTLGGSLSEGSCISSPLSSKYGSSLLSARHSHSQPSVLALQSPQNPYDISHNGSFCSCNSCCRTNGERDDDREDGDPIEVSSVSFLDPCDPTGDRTQNVSSLADTQAEDNGNTIYGLYLACMFLNVANALYKSLKKSLFHVSCVDRKLQRIMEELLLTEREYVRSLGYVREHYFPELERPDVPQDLRGQRGSIFGNLEKLHDFHRHHFLKELEGCLREPFRVGRSFLRHRECFGLYALYSKNKPKSDGLLLNHGHDFFKQKQIELGDKMDLSSYLLKPVQRISKYSLLLQDMVRDCGPHRGREEAEVRRALEVIQFQLRHGNNLLAMDDIQDCDVNLKEQGQLIRQDEFLVSFRKKKCFRHIFLFQDLVLFSKTKWTDVGNDTYVYKQSFKFEDGILEACLRILEMNPKCLRNPGKDASGRKNPIYVSRVLSAMVNCNDDKGVLLGRWTDDYDGGVSPLSWKGSVEILRNWDTNACQPVRFGQCWVFAAVACSVSRALGIPCRVVTNYNSAHDTNSNLVIERYVDENGQLVQKSKDMIWNYHCWVENWMTRPDLKPGYDGWQAMDPTPQEKSEGVYCCGPIPLKAIKEGELTYKYDAPFVFAEVNADVHTFMKREDGSTEKIISSVQVGLKISTKSVGSDRREDITHLYKYPEGSDEEREAFTKANHQNKLLKQQTNAGLLIAIKVSAEMKKGCDFDVFAVVMNNTPNGKKCRLVFGSRAVSYNGILGENCGFKDLLNVELAPGEEKRVPLRMNYSKYAENLTEDNLIRLAALLLDYGTREAYLAVRNVVLENPEIKVRILGEPKENRKLVAEITLQNPLPVPLQNCCFTVEGSNLTGGQIITEKLNSTVEPGQDAKVKIYFTPTHSGQRKLVVDFDSNKLGHVKGYRNVIIGK